MSALQLPDTFPVACHTRNVGPGSTFVAIKGSQKDGASYIQEALQQGATTIVISATTQLSKHVARQIQLCTAKLIRVKNSRRALAKLSAARLGHPAKKLKLLGVTGTKGKTTTCFLLEHMLRSAGYKTALLSSVHNAIGTTTFVTDLTTKQPDYLNVFFNVCARNEVEFVVMEVAAQALSLERIFGLTFAGLIFTNFDTEHGEFYASMDEYFVAKAAIFEQLGAHAPALFNADDKRCADVFEGRSNFFSFGAHQSAHVQFRVHADNRNGLVLQLGGVQCECPSLFGLFNAYNIAAAAGLLQKCAVPTQHIQKGLLTFPGVSGRLQMHQMPNGAHICIDKAHNPSSYKAILGTLRTMTDYLLVVFGCGGGRDKGKRSMMGAIAAQLCDVVILTSDDPRFERPEAIIADILVGIGTRDRCRVVEEVDRARAISIAYARSRPGSIIALLGKGTDKYQLVKGTKHYFSEMEIIEGL